jgi:hypothetical protein
MVQPYNYSLNVPSATESFMQGIQMAQAFRKQAAQNESLERAKQFQADLTAIKDDPSPQNLTSLYAKYPDFGTDLDRISKSMGEADKRTYGTILQRAIIAKQGKASPEEIAAIYTEGATAAQNSGKTDVAERFKAAASFATNPQMDDDFAARSLLNQFLPDDYKIIYEQEKEPFIISEGAAFLRGPLMRLAKDVERLAAGDITSQAFDSTWGEGKASQYIQTGKVEVNPDFDVPTQADIDMLKAGKISPAVFNQAFGPKAADKYIGGQTAAPSGTFQGQ